jgi:hypothetical protein
MWRSFPEKSMHICRVEKMGWPDVEYIAVFTEIGRNGKTRVVFWVRVVEISLAQDCPC